MGKRILVALDDSDNAMRAVEFAANSFTNEHEITLYSVVPDTAAICQLDSPSLVPHFRQQQQSFCAIEEQKKNLIKSAMDKARRILIEAGFSDDKVVSKLHIQKKNIAQDIIQEAHTGYRAIVMGRRGLSGFKGLVLGSVSQKVLHAAKGLSVVIVE